MQINYFLIAIIACLFSIVLSFPVVKICKKLKCSQTILHYVEEHAGKSGTPTMGGIIFLLAGSLAYVFFTGGQDLYAWLSLVVMLAYGVLGFLDDFTKVRFKQNKGLLAWQKVVGQVAISLIVALFVYFKVGTSLDFFGLNLELGWGIIPFTMFVFLAITNSVNLTDGLDGLAGSVSAVYILFFALILTLSASEEMLSLSLVSFGMFGAILGFLVINTFPAKIFMGDTGSLALGGFIACIGVFSKVLLMPIMGFVFVVSALSVVIQVLHFKRTKKRVFLMAPFHHHLQKKGLHENRIVAIYIVLTAVLSAICLCVRLAI